MGVLDSFAVCFVDLESSATHLKRPRLAFGHDLEPASLFGRDMLRAYQTLRC